MRDWDFDGQLARTLRISAFLLVFFCLSLVSRPKDPVALGFAVGTATGMWNAYFLAKRVRAVIGLPVRQAKVQMRVGFVLRLAIILAVLFFVARTPSVSLYAAAAGMFVVPCVFTFGAVGVSLREQRLNSVLKYKSKN